ncbi:patatin-like phospholipase family protein [Enteractinococcus coprophilus]|uniref:Putative patatin/cPLA2 family phospholipase n=1 Tax=Enteractinococcus coprophilus TaxID=1027633 RepID=A0A543APC1_9MICC|nr:patatin family protein [Enteractinococcus coprophilus]TQL74427.1 putative patatin/cPLA2 family phospholipase [Enteractinococcus coprophilus]
MPYTTLLQQTALLFEGGGMRASYTSGMVVALLEEDIHAPFVAGISAGASNTANYLSLDAPRARASFTDFAADPDFGDWRTFLRGKGLFHAEYIYERAGLPGMPLAYDWNAFQQNPADFRIGGFDIHSGATVWWGRNDAPELPDLMRRVRASSTMPIVMPPVNIDGRTYVDGALGTDGGVPISVAQGLGYDRFLVVLTREREYRKEPEKFPTFYRTYFRKYPAVADALLTRWWRYNQTREKLFELEAEGNAYLFVPEVMPVANGERNVAKLNAAHRCGLEQARREMPAIKEFLGL